jgi:uncharacterized membrane protein (UPF0182 family)
MSSNLTNGDQPPTEKYEWASQIPIRTLGLTVKLGLVILVCALLFLFLYQAKGIYTNWLWFESLGFHQVFSTILVLKIWLFFAGSFIFLALISVNVYAVYRANVGESTIPMPEDLLKLARIGVIVAMVAGSTITSVIFGAIASSHWETFLVFFNRVDFGVTDPQFGKDISFYATVLPMLQFLQGWIMGAIISILVATIALSLLIHTIRGLRFSMTRRFLIHLSIMGVLLMLSIAAAHFLDRYETLFSDSGASVGASYADVHARIPALWIVTGIALISAIGFIVGIRIGGLRTMIASFGLWALFAVVVGGVFPALVQRFYVVPDEFNKEKVYITRNLEATRSAYNLTNVSEQPFSYTPSLTQEDIDENHKTINNIRLWDPVPLTSALNQIQFFQLYYNFINVDIDRYTIDGEYRQVMLSARELAPENLPKEAQTWINKRLQYTHGYGATVSPVTTYTPEGQPEFLLRDIPPKGKLDVTRPQIYYGENTNDFVIVNTKTAEFDFPGGEGELPIRNTYDGSGGVRIGSFLRKLAYAWEFQDINIFISNQITSNSKILYRRLIQDRIQEVVPFLKLDPDPYLVVADGKLWWIQDAYTTTSSYPYSTPSDEGFNYIRNSVKVIVDAHNGTLRFYIVDPEDPMVLIYQKAFPDLFEPVSEPDPFHAIPEPLRAHVRYPEGLFTIQANQYLQYHIRDPEVFFRRDDQWAIGKELFFKETQQVRPYYVIMKLPGEMEEEFILMMPFTPFGDDKKKMVAWLAARNDAPHYGELRTFTFSTDVFGPEQVEARITNDDTIRERLTLLCPEGVICIRGNLLVIPLGKSVLYVEPLFIRPKDLDFPELKQVFVADGTSVFMADTLEEGLAGLVAKGVGTPASAGDAKRKTPTWHPQTLQELQELIDEFIRGQRDSLAELKKELQNVVDPSDGSIE